MAISCHGGKLAFLLLHLTHLLVNVITDSTVNESTSESTSDSMARVTAGTCN